MATLKRYNGSTWAAVNTTESGIETFESYTVGDNIIGKSGPIGDWSDGGGSGSYTCKAAAGQVLECIDDTAAEYYWPKLTFDTYGHVNDKISFEYKTSSLTAGQVFVYGDNGLLCQLPHWDGSGALKAYNNAPTPVDVHQAISANDWHTFWIKITGTNTFRIVLVDGQGGAEPDWDSVHDHQCRIALTTHITGWGCVGSGSGNITSTTDNIRPKWTAGSTPESGIDLFNTYTIDTEINGQSGPLGDWTSVATTNGTNKVEHDGSNHVLHCIDASGGEAPSAYFKFDSSGSINGTDSIEWKQKVNSGLFPVLVYDNDLHIKISFYFGYSGAHVYYYDGGGFVDAGIDYTAATWETWEIRFKSTTKFNLRVGGGAWSGDLTCRGTWDSTGAECGHFYFGGTTSSVYNALVDDIKPSWVYVPASKLKYCSGGTWTFAAKALKYYNGATWVAVS